MWKFIVKRLIMLIPVLIGVTLLVFLILQLAPGDPAKVILGEQATPEQIQELRESLGLNDPVLVQYANYIIKLVQGDMGESYKTRGPVSDEVFNRFPNTIKLTACAMLLAVVVAVPLGVVAAVKQNTLFDSISMVIALIGVSMPIFWLGLLLILLFSLKLGLFPSSGSEGIEEHRAARRGSGLQPHGIYRQNNPFLHAGDHSSGLHPYGARQGRGLWRCYP